MAKQHLSDVDPIDYRNFHNWHKPNSVPRMELCKSMLKTLLSVSEHGGGITIPYEKGPGGFTLTYGRPGEKEGSRLYSDGEKYYFLSLSGLSEKKTGHPALKTEAAEEILWPFLSFLHYKVIEEVAYRTFRMLLSSDRKFKMKLERKRLEFHSIVLGKDYQVMEQFYEPAAKSRDLEINKRKEIAAFVQYQPAMAAWDVRLISHVISDYIEPKSD